MTESYSFSISFFESFQLTYSSWILASSAGSILALLESEYLGSRSLIGMLVDSLAVFLVRVEVESL